MTSSRRGELGRAVMGLCITANIRRRGRSSPVRYVCVCLFVPCPPAHARWEDELMFGGTHIGY